MSCGSNTLWQSSSNTRWTGKSLQTRTAGCFVEQGKMNVSSCPPPFLLDVDLAKSLDICLPHLGLSEGGMAQKEQVVKHKVKRWVVPSNLQQVSHSKTRDLQRNLPRTNRFAFLSDSGLGTIDLPLLALVPKDALEISKSAMRTSCSCGASNCVQMPSHGHQVIPIHILQ